MIEIRILRNFQDMGLFKVLCEDYGGIVLDDTITFPNHQTFGKVVNLLIPVFLPRKMRKYLDFKEIHNETDTT